MELRLAMATLAWVERGSVPDDDGDGGTLVSAAGVAVCWRC